MKIGFKPSFIRLYGKLNSDLKNEVKETIELLKNKENHKKIKVHKLHGKLSKFHSCYVNYTHRIIFEKKTKEIVLRHIGTHDIYR